MPTYKTRKCEVCDKEFIPCKASQVVCSEECKKYRGAWYDREYRKRRNALIANLQAENSSLKARITELEKELEAFKDSGANLKKPKQDLKFDTSGFEFCERMRLKMEKLPCGEHEVCWQGNACEHTKGLDDGRCKKLVQAKMAKWYTGDFVFRNKPKIADEHYRAQNNPLEDV